MQCFKTNLYTHCERRPLQIYAGMQIICDTLIELLYAKHQIFLNSFLINQVRDVVLTIIPVCYSLSKSLISSKVAKSAYRTFLISVMQIVRTVIVLLETKDCVHRAVGWTTGVVSFHIHCQTNNVWVSFYDCCSDDALSAIFPRLFILTKWISCVIVLLSWAWCCWPLYCCTCCCHPFARAAWSRPLKRKEWV